jgi:hypothetical protein
MVHKLHLTDEEYKQLALACYLGNWIANAQAIPGEEPYPGLEKVLQKVYKQAQENHIEGMKIVYEYGEYSCREHDGLDNSVAYPIIEDYDEQSMFENLAHYLSRRDAYNELKHSKKNLNELDELNLETKKYNEYIEEFSKHGLGRLVAKTEGR